MSLACHMQKDSIFRNTAPAAFSVRRSHREAPAKYLSSLNTFSVRHSHREAAAKFIALYTLSTIKKRVTLTIDSP